MAINSSPKPLVRQPTKTLFVQGVNDLATMLPKLAQEWSSKNILNPHHVYYKSNKSATWVCDKGHQYDAVIATRVRGTECSICWNNQRSEVAILREKAPLTLGELYPQLAKELTHPSLAYYVSQSSHRSVSWNCSKYSHHNHTYSLSVNQRLAGRDCPYCGLRKLLPGFNDVLSVRPDLGNQIVDNKIARNTLANSKQLLEWKHLASGKVEHYWSQSAVDRVYGDAGCTVCRGKTIQLGVNDFGVFLDRRNLRWSAENKMDPDQISLGSNQKIILECIKHNPANRMVSGAKDFSSGKRVCQDCRPTVYRSRGEIEVINFLRDSFPKWVIESNVRRFKKLGIHEIDIFLPEINVAVDFDGTYWHQEGIFKPMGFHKSKKKAMERLNFSYFVIGEEDWKNEQKAVKDNLQRFVSESIYFVSTKSSFLRIEVGEV
jgi:hypothetical protein